MCWGSNGVGQIGNGTRVWAVPTPVTPLGLGGGGATAPTIPSEGHRWIVSLGDSYTSGNGVPPYYTTGKCSRSYNAYPWLYLNRLRSTGRSADIWHAACGGAITDDVPQQISSVLKSPAGNKADIVLLTIGGNDLTFSPIVKDCLLPLHAQTIVARSLCSSRINTALDALPTVIAKTGSILRGLATKMPHAEIVLLGYPALTSPVCPRTPWNEVITTAQKTFSLQQQALIARLNSSTGTERFHFVPTMQPFLQHGPCAAQATQWINGASLNPLAYHPNLKGNKKLADLLVDGGFLH
jgi:lysophospholipase L1-like esterase